MKVGDYVRTDDGCICKVLEYTEISNNDYYVNTDSPYNVIYKSWIIKHSPNIIDLIEVGDYVNGQEVRYIGKGNGYCYLAIDEDYTYLIAGYDKDGLTMPIKSIVTHEQFSSMEYKVGE